MRADNGKTRRINSALLTLPLPLPPSNVLSQKGKGLLVIGVTVDQLSASPALFNRRSANVNRILNFNATGTGTPNRYKY